MVVGIDRHDLEDGMVVRLSEVQGIPALNSREFKVSTVGPFVFSIGPIPDCPGEYIKGGLFEEIKQPISVSFESLKSQLEKPFDMWNNFVPIDHSKMFDAPQQMLFILAVLEFRAAHEGRLPRNQDEHDASQVVELAKNINSQVHHVEDQVDEALLRQFAKVARGDLNPLAAMFGGIIAQEVIKASSVINSEFHFISFHWDF